MKALLVAAVFAMSSPAFATGTQGSTGQQTTTTSSNSASEATNNGNTQSIVFTSPASSTSTVNGRQEVVYSGSQTVRNVPSVSGPALTSSNDTCMGSVTGSVNVAGFGGSLGSTYKDVNCVMLKNARELWNMGMRGAALARMCMDADNRDALEITGFECPQTTRGKQNAVSTQTAAQAGEPTDPIVRARLGLPALPTAPKKLGE